MHRIPNHKRAHTSSFPCIRPHHRQPEPVVSTLAAAAVPVPPSPHSRRHRVLSGAVLVVTRLARRTRGVSCPWEAHRRKLSKVEIHLDHRHRYHLGALFLVDLALRRRAVASVGFVRSFALASLFRVPDFFFRRWSIASTWCETSDREEEDMRLGCSRTFSCSSFF